MKGATTLADGQLLVIPRVLGDLGPGTPLIPDSELVFSGAGAGFDPQEFALEQGGYLGVYEGFAEGPHQSRRRRAALVARNHSINPRLLVALLEYQSGWVTNPIPAGEGLNYPLGHRHPYLRQSELAADLGGHRARGRLLWLARRHPDRAEVPDGTTLRLDPALNAGTVALQYFFAQDLNRPDWDLAVGDQGFVEHLLSPVWRSVRAGAQPAAAGRSAPGAAVDCRSRRAKPGTYTGGPHGAWERGGAQAALDFAPPSTASGCAESGAWVTAVAAGLVLRSELGVVVLDLDGDGREATGWNILYLHIAENQRVKEGAFVERGDRIGHPSCEGGRATGTHVHIARKYNGEWILADGVIPFNLEGWVAGPGAG